MAFCFVMNDVSLDFGNRIMETWMNSINLVEIDYRIVDLSHYVQKSKRNKRYGLHLNLSLI